MGSFTPRELGHKHGLVPAKSAHLLCAPGPYSTRPGNLYKPSIVFPQNSNHQIGPRADPTIIKTQQCKHATTKFRHEQIPGIPERSRLKAKKYSKYGGKHLGLRGLQSCYQTRACNDNTLKMRINEYKQTKL